MNVKDAYNKAAKDFDNLIEITDELRPKIHEALLEMYDDFMEVCQKHDISSMLVGGSMLGAIRHKGFIPWDEDIDVAMLRNEYERFVLIFEQEMSHKYMLSAPNYNKHPRSRFPKIIKKGTVYRDVGVSPEMGDGLFLDIFIIENVPDGKLHRFIKGHCCNFLEIVASVEQIRESKSLVLKSFVRNLGFFSYISRKVLGWIFSFNSATTWVNRIDKMARYRNENTQFCSIPTGRKHYFGEILPRSVFTELTTVEFCGRKAFIPKNYHQYLTNLYGDYMQIPPQENRERHFIEAMKL